MPIDFKLSKLHRQQLGALLVLLALAVAMFADVLFTSRDVVLSSPGTDTFHFFVHWRKFGFEQLRQGNLALWNPHHASGMPFFGGFQSALLYLPNALFLVLPLAKAINFSIALHVFLAGAFMFAWASQCGLHPVAAFLSGVLCMFGGTYFLHIYAGHLPNLCTMVWVPLLFLAIDRIFEKPSVGGCLLGMFAVAMMILAGHLQYVYYTAIAAGIYCALCFAKSSNRGRTLAALVVLCIGGVGISAVQLLTGIQESGETLRSGGLTSSYAGMFSFPPENFLTLLAPEFFGDLKHSAYWGRGYPWEMGLFLGVTGIALAILGAVRGERRTRRFSVVMVAVLLLLALGSYTPLFKLLFHVVPGYDKFRGNSKFIFQASLFLALLAGMGLDHILRTQKFPRGWVAGTAGAGIFLELLAFGIRQSARANEPEGWWNQSLVAARRGEYQFFPEAYYASPDFNFKAGGVAAGGLAIAGGTALLLALLCFLATRERRWVGGIVLLAVVELFIFGRRSLATFELAAAEPQELKEFLSAHPGDFRIVNPRDPNSAMSLGVEEMWVDDPGVLRRYGEFLAFMQGQNLAEVRQDIPMTTEHRLFKMFRRRYLIIPQPDGKLRVLENTNGLPRLLLVEKYRVLSGRDDIFAAMGGADFEPEREVILETEPRPNPAPAGKTGGVVRLVDSSTDHATIEAELPAAAILLITDAYAKGWRARALPGSGQEEYQILPANYCLRAIPLAAGRHRFRMEYLPSGFAIGKWISLITTCAFVGLTGWVGLKKIDRPRRRPA